MKKSTNINSKSLKVKMKSPIKLLSAGLLSILLLAGGGCSSGSKDQPSPTTATLSLTSSKTSILADGEDAASLSVYYSGSQKDVTAEAELFANDKPLSTSEFTAATPGTYTIKATYDGVTSNLVTITAVSGESAEGITLKASKTGLYPDGGDFVVLTLQTADGSDVTAQGTFFANGEQLAANRFSTTTGSLAPVQITAKFNGLDVNGSVQVTASKNYVFTSRLLLEDITKTNCQFCPSVIHVIEKLREDAQPVVVPISIHNSNSSVYNTYYSDATRAFADEFCEFVNVDKSVAPKVYVNRSKTEENTSYLSADDLRSKAINGSKEVAIALESSLSGQTVTAKVTVGSKKNFTGKIVVVLTENGIKAEQYTMGLTEMYRMMRAYAPSLEGQAKSFATDVPTTFETSFDLTALQVVNTANCEVIAFVTDDADGLCENVQFAKVGEIKGY